MLTKNQADAWHPGLLVTLAERPETFCANTVLADSISVQCTALNGTTL